MAVDTTDSSSPASRESGPTPNTSTDSAAPPAAKRCRPHIMEIGTQAYLDLEAAADRVPGLEHELQGTRTSMMREREEMAAAIFKLQTTHVAELEELHIKLKGLSTDLKNAQAELEESKASREETTALLREAELEAEKAQKDLTKYKVIAETSTNQLEVAWKERNQLARELSALRDSSSSSTGSFTGPNPRPSLGKPTKNAGRRK